jgi:hypothetical protein
MRRILLPIFYVLLVVVFFWQFFFKGLLPIPSDTIVGLYYPFRDIYAKTNPNGVPFKNFLITDPVRQLYPWKNLSILDLKQKAIPAWNPYNFSGTPLLANLQSSSFYPTNIFFFLMPFDLAWSLLIFIQPLLGGLFMYLYLRNLKLKEVSSFIGAISFAFSGFFIAWLEWGTVLNTALWLPLTLFSLDKIFSETKSRIKWFLILLCSLLFSFFGGHLQTFFYLAILSFMYSLLMLFSAEKKLKKGIYLVLTVLAFIVFSSVQWFPTLKFITLSARNLDMIGWKAEGWFIPWQNLVQFIAPDFFGNPTTLNYYGIWNYAEFLGYVGIIPLIFAIFALFFKKDKKVFFFGSVFFVSLIFAFPTIIAKIPFKLLIPFVSTSQPTRLLFVVDFSLAVLAAIGFDYFMTHSKNRSKILYVLGVFIAFFGLLWLFVNFFGKGVLSQTNLLVAKQNLILPTFLFAISLLVLLAIIFYPENKIKQKVLNVGYCLLILITVFDLFRFGWKFESFTKKDYLFPKTPVTSFLQKNIDNFRLISTDSTILPPNFSIMYKLQTVDGYDPLYLQRYGELMAAIGRGRSDISAPFGFNRIITQQNPSSRLVDLLGVKYVLSKVALEDNKLREVFKDGEITVYENDAVFPRAFFVVNTLIVDSKQKAINELFNLDNPLRRIAIVEGVKNRASFRPSWNIGKVDIKHYSSNKIVLDTYNSGSGFLMLTDSYYPTWKASIDGEETEIFLTDYNFKGIIVPEGKHIIEFTNSLF